MEEKIHAYYDPDWAFSPGDSAFAKSVKSGKQKAAGSNPVANCHPAPEN
jgi:hypothetical protein